MVEIAMPPPGFDLAKALAGTETVPAPSPAEPASWGKPPGWGARSGEFKQGYMVITAEQRRRAEEAEADRQRMAGVIKHAAVRAAEARAREAAAEAERKARGDPETALQAFLEERADAETAVADIAVQAERAQALVDALEARQSGVKDAVLSADQAAAERLLAAIEAGDTELPLNPRSDAVQSEAAKISAKLGVARAALEQIEHRRSDANARLEHCRRQVEGAAIDTLIAEMAETADQILAIAADLAQRRAELRDMEYFTANRYRSMTGVLPSLPAQIGQALNPAPAPAPTLFSVGDWPQRFAALIAAPGGT